MKAPPKEWLDKMVAQGTLGLLSSIVTLGAALAVRHGHDGDGLPEISTAGGDPLPREVLDAMAGAHLRVREELRTASSEELDATIALCTAHLKLLGYHVAHGTEHES